MVAKRRCALNAVGISAGKARLMAMRRCEGIISCPVQGASSVTEDPTGSRSGSGSMPRTRSL